MWLSAVTSETPELSVMSDCAVASRAAHSAPSEQLAAPRLPGETETGVVLTPLQNSVSPATEVIIGIVAAALYVPVSPSEMRPAHPVAVAPLAAAFCHSVCWSGWENRLEGAVPPPRYCDLVSGVVSVPTFTTIAATPL